MAFITVNLPMLSIPSKKTEKVEYIPALENFIKQNFGDEMLKTQHDSLNDLQQLREDIRLAQDKSENTLKLYQKYLVYLQSLGLRFPISESNVRLTFTWFDSYKGNKKQSRYSLVYEKASILFNIGSHYSQMASQNRNTDEGIKRAANYYQLASGCFGKIKEILQQYPQDSATLDLTMDSLSALSNIMLAQAQECFFEKAFKGNFQPTILAKISAQVADYYEVAANLLNLPNLKSNVDKIWPIFTQTRAHYYYAIANYYSGLAQNKLDQYGVEIAHYQKSLMLINEAKKQIKQLTPEFQDAINKFHIGISKAAQSAEADNSRIYHEPVPREAPIIEKKSMTKSIPPEDGVLNEDTDPFYKLVPFEVLQSISIYGEMKASLVRAELQRIEEYNGIAKSSLFSTGLPGSIQAFESPTGIPQSLADKIYQLQTKGGIGKLYDLQDALSKLAKDNEELLAVSLDQLDNEETEDNTLRQTYGDKWTRTPSHTLTANLRQEALKYQGNMDHARKSDAYIKKKFTDHEELITLLSGPNDEIVKFLPASGGSEVSNSEIVTEIKSALRLLDGVIEARQNLYAELKKLSERDDVTSKLYSADSKEAVFEQELKKYEPIKARLQSNFTEQEKALTKISALNEQFIAIKQSNQVNLERESALQKLDLAYKSFLELEANYREGIQFYKNFYDIITKFKVTVDDFVLARTTEKTELLSGIQHSIQREQQRLQQQTQAQVQTQATALQPQPQLHAQAPQMVYAPTTGMFPSMPMGGQTVLIDPNTGAPVAWPQGMQFSPQLLQQPQQFYYLPTPGSAPPPPYPGQ